MGLIIDELQDLLKRHVDEHGIVIWFDAERHYESALAEIKLGEARLVCYIDSFYRLRHEAEPWLRTSDVPRLVVYLPVEYDTARLPLAELLAFGATIRPGEKGLANTRLSVIAGRALKPFLSEAKLATLDREIEENKLALRDLENLALGGGETALPTVLAIIYETSYLDDATIRFLASSEKDSQLVEKNAASELAEMLQRNYGAPVTTTLSLAEMRIVLTRHLLWAEFCAGLGDDVPSAYQTIPTAKEPALVQRCVETVRAWRNRLDTQASYASAARKVESSLHLATIGLSFGSLQKVETFLETERQLLREVARRLSSGPDEEAEQVARDRRKKYWAIEEPGLQANWDLLLQAAELLRFCQRIDLGLKKTWSALELATTYTQDDQPWCMLDTLHRQLEKKASSLEFVLTEQPAEVEALVTVTRQRYADTVGRLAEAFTRALAAANFELSGWYRQIQTFERAVAPLLEGKRVAYLMVDALRFELARELAGLLSGDFDVNTEGVTGTMPGVTEVGMAALLPHASSGFRICVGKKDGLEVLIGETALRSREDRITYIEKRAGVPVVTAKLEDPKQLKAKLNKLGDGPVLVVLTSREIDRAGEEELVEARRYMDEVLRHIRLALHLLVKAGIEHFVVATDHGYFYGEDLADSEKIDAPGGRTLLLHRRVWVGQGGAANESILRTSLSKLGVTSELEIAVPWNLAGFKAGGSEAYFHGGLAPQEFLLPLLHLRPKAAAGREVARKIIWRIQLGSAKVTAAHLTITITGEAGLFETEWPRVRVEVRSSGEACSIPVSASYGFSDSTGEVVLHGVANNSRQIEPNAVTLMLTPKAPQRGAVSIHLLDAVTGVELKKLDSVEVSRVF